MQNKPESLLWWFHFVFKFSTPRLTSTWVVCCQTTSWRFLLTPSCLNENHVSLRLSWITQRAEEWIGGSRDRCWDVVHDRKDGIKVDRISGLFFHPVISERTSYSMCWGGKKIGVQLSSPGCKIDCLDFTPEIWKHFVKWIYSSWFSSLVVTSRENVSRSWHYFGAV